MLRAADRRAFTLLEMLLAVALFAVGTVAVMELLHRAQAGQADGENVLVATHLAHRCQEALQNVSYVNLASQANTVCTVPSGGAFTRFTRTVTVTPMTSTAPYSTANLTQLDVQIAWTAAGGSANVTLSTLRAAN